MLNVGDQPREGVAEGGIVGVIRAKHRDREVDSAVVPMKLGFAVKELGHNATDLFCVVGKGSAAPGADD